MDGWMEEKKTASSEELLPQDGSLSLPDITSLPGFILPGELQPILHDCTCEYIAPFGSDQTV